MAAKQKRTTDNQQSTSKAQQLQLRAFLPYVRRIPKGKVSTYGQIAYAAGFPGAARQVAWALHQSRGLPWHRVIGAGGRILLGGEMGFEQRMRLEAEGVTFRGLRVRMDLHQVAFSKITRRKRQQPMQTD